MHIMVHCKSCEIYRLLKTALILWVSPSQSVCRTSVINSVTSNDVAQTHCLYSNFHLDDLKTAV